MQARRNGSLDRRGSNEISGRKPINPSGGLLGKGHPLGATGVAQVREIVLQLRGKLAGVRSKVPGSALPITVEELSREPKEPLLS